MATLNVPGSYSTISAAVAAAQPGDTITVAAGYAGNETVDVTEKGLSFDAPASVMGIVLTVAPFIGGVTLLGASPIDVRGYRDDYQDNDRIVGNAGANRLNGGGGSDTLSGGDGDDTLEVNGDGRDTLSGGAGNDTFLLAGYFPRQDGGTLDGGAGVDTVIASELGRFRFGNVEVLDTDGIVGATLAQLSSFDRFTDADGNRVAFALYGKGGKLDLQHKLDGNDRVSIDGSKLSSGLTVAGTTRRDVLDGSGYNDRLDGGGGNDRLYASQGRDTLNGGNGADAFDLLFATSKSGGVIDGGAGIDTVSSGELRNFRFKNVEILYAENDGSATIGQLSAFRHILNESGTQGRVVVDLHGTGGRLDFSHRLAGKALIDVSAEGLTSGVILTGTANNDIIEGSKHRDTLSGGGGRDIFLLHRGSGKVDGGAGLDTVKADRLDDFKFRNVEVLETPDGYVSGTISTLSAFEQIDTAYSRQVTVDLHGAGGTIDLSQSVRAAHVLVDGTALTSAVVLTGTRGSDTLVGSKYDDVLDGGIRDDTLKGKAGDDKLMGGAGADSLIGGDGDDRLDGKQGADRLSGGHGDDTYVTDGKDTIVELAKAGLDTVRSSADLRLAGNVENLVLTGKAGIDGTGNASANHLTGNAESNVLDGRLGNDILKGGLGADTFVFDTALGAGNVDHIVDFVSASAAVHDTIRLAPGVFKGLGGRALAEGAFKDLGVAGATIDDGDRILYDSKTGALSYDADGSGAGQAVLFAVLDNSPILTYHDFLVA